MDPGCAPQRVFPAHPPDQIPQAAIDLWPPCPISGFPAPEHFETSAMPSQDGLRLNHLSRINKARPELSYPYEQRAITAAKAKAGWRSPQSDGKLMAEKQILSFKPAPRLDQWCDDFVFTMRIWAGWNFRKGQSWHGHRRSRAAAGGVSKGDVASGALSARVPYSKPLRGSV